MNKEANAEYVEKAKLLAKEEQERLLSRMKSKLARRLEDKKLTDLECMAIQLEIEEEDLEKWREKVAELRKRSKSKKSD